MTDNYCLSKGTKQEHEIDKLLESERIKMEFFSKTQLDNLLRLQR